MAQPTTRQELIDYAKRALGEPVLQVNVEDSQCDDRVDEALSMYQEYHSDAITRHFLKYQITATDITNEYLTIDSGLTSVVRVLPFGDGLSSGTVNMFSASYQIAFNDLYYLRGGTSGITGNLASYYQTRSYANLVNSMFGPGLIQTRFSRHADRLFLDIEWGTDIQEGDWVVVEGYVINDPETYDQVYNDMWLKQYTVQLIKRQWGANLKKFEGMQLPGGVTFNGQTLFDEATAEIIRLEEELRLNWENPIDFYVG